MDNQENQDNQNNEENPDNQENQENQEDPNKQDNLENLDNQENANSPVNPESEQNPQSQGPGSANNPESPLNPESQANPESVINPETPNVENQENNENQENVENQNSPENEDNLNNQENQENNEVEGNKDEEMNNNEPKSSQNQSQMQNQDLENAQEENQNFENQDGQPNPEEINKDNPENNENQENQDNLDNNEENLDNPENNENQENQENLQQNNQIVQNQDNPEENNDEINNEKNNHEEGDFQEEDKEIPIDSKGNSQNISKDINQKSVNEENRPNSIEPQDDSKLNIAGEVAALANLNETPENIEKKVNVSKDNKDKSNIQNIAKPKQVNNLKEKSEFKPGKNIEKHDHNQIDRPSDSSGHQISMLQSKKKLGSKIGTGESESQGSQNDLPERIGKIVSSQSSEVVTKEELRSILVNFSKDIIQSFVSKKELSKSNEKDTKKRDLEMIDKINEMVDEVNKQKRIISDVRRKMGDPQSYEEMQKFSSKPGEKRNPYSNKPDPIQLDQKGNELSKDILRQFLSQMKTICLESKIVFTEYIKEYIKNEFKLFDKIISMDPANSKYKQGYTNLNGDEFSKRLDNLYKNIERQINEKGKVGKSKIK